MAIAADRISDAYNVQTIYTPQYTDIYPITEKTKRLLVFAQHMDPLPVGRGLGSVLPEAVKAAGAVGVMLNHCERPCSLNHLYHTIRRAKELELLTIVCADTPAEASAMQRKQLEENPLLYVKAPKVPKKRIKIFTQDEISLLIEKASEFQNAEILEWDLLITLAITTGMRKSELLNLIWDDIDFTQMTVEVNAKENTRLTWEWRIKDTNHRTLPLMEDVKKLLLDLKDRRPGDRPYVFIPCRRYEYIQQLRQKGKWTLIDSKNNVINNFTRQFNKLIKLAGVYKRTFHDIRRTAITNWFRQGLSEFDVMALAGHANFETTHKFYLAIADDLLARARNAVTHQVSQKLLTKRRQHHLRIA